MRGARQLASDAVGTLCAASQPSLALMPLREMAVGNVCAEPPQLAWS